MFSSTCGGVRQSRLSVRACVLGTWLVLSSPSLFQ